jgi:hypothetical protein
VIWNLIQIGFFGESICINEMLEWSWTTLHQYITFPRMDRHFSGLKPKLIGRSICLVGKVYKIFLMVTNYVLKVGREYCNLSVLSYSWSIFSEADYRSFPIQSSHPFENDHWPRNSDLVRQNGHCCSVYMWNEGWCCMQQPIARNCDYRPQPKGKAVTKW